MIKHIVMWRLKEFELGNERQVNAHLVREKLTALRGRIPGMTALEVGVDFSQSDSSCDIVLYSEFVDREALEAYQINPEHEAIKPFIGRVSMERRIADYEVLV